MAPEIPSGIDRIARPMPSYLATVNYYLLWDQSDVYLVDTGLDGPDAMDSLLAALARRSLTPRDLRAVILTHTHRDHAGLVPALQRRWGIQVWMHQAESVYLGQGQGRTQQLAQEMGRWMAGYGVPQEIIPPIQASLIERNAHQEPFRADRFLADGEIIRVGAMSWQVLVTPGHTPGHICLWEPDRRVLLTGDHLLPNDTPNISFFPEIDADPLGAFLRAHDRIAGLGAKLACPGHGETFSSIVEQVRAIHAHHDKRVGWIERALADGGLHTAYQVACAIPWVHETKRFGNLQPHEQRLAFGETVAHLHYLANRGSLRAEKGAQGNPRFQALGA